jgi:C_GCAxxG_C_C family probable redox protein
MVESIGTRALKHFDDGLYCAESVLVATCEALDLQSNVVPRIATGLCSGMARTGGTCGALSGAILGIGLVVGRDSGEVSVEPAYLIVRRLVEAFLERHGSTACPELIECDLGTTEGQRIFKEEHRVERCRRYVQEAGDMLMQMTAAAGRGIGT